MILDQRGWTGFFQALGIVFGGGLLIVFLLTPLIKVLDWWIDLWNPVETRRRKE